MARNVWAPNSMGPSPYILIRGCNGYSGWPEIPLVSFDATCSHDSWMGTHGLHHTSIHSPNGDGSPLGSVSSQLGIATHPIHPRQPHTIVSPPHHTSLRGPTLPHLTAPLPFQSRLTPPHPTPTHATPPRPSPAHPTPPKPSYSNSGCRLARLSMHVHVVWICLCFRYIMCSFH